MNKKFVQVLADVHCKWEGLDPIYRVYVNDELFVERTWRWPGAYLEEMLQIEAKPGDYEIRYELVPPHLARLKVKNLRVEQGPATVETPTLVRIHNWPD
jgi:hypothetical protein